VCGRIDVSGEEGLVGGGAGDTRTGETPLEGGVA